MERKKAAETWTRVRSMQPASSPQFVKPLTQKSSPVLSGGRLRKSQYCCEVKKVGSSIGLGVGVGDGVGVGSGVGVGEGEGEGVGVGVGSGVGEGVGVGE